MLSVNPALKWNEVRDILKMSCDKIDSNCKNVDEANLTPDEKKDLEKDLEIRKYDKNGHSPGYGYGRINAEKAVLLAVKIKNAPPKTGNHTLGSRLGNPASSRERRTVIEQRDKA